MKLYKYTTDEIGLKIIRGNEIRFSQPGSLNDLFEMVIKFKGELSQEAVINLINDLSKAGKINEIWKNIIKSGYDNLNPKSKSYFTKEEFEAFFEQYFYHVLNKENKSIPELLYEKIFSKPQVFNNLMINEWTKTLNNYVGVFCLSKTYDNEIMWSSYADENKGVVIEFDTDHFFYQPIIKVEYDDRIPFLDLAEIEEIGNNPFKYLELVKVKKVKWKEEKEYRVFKLLKYSDRRSKELDPKGFTIHLFKFPPQCLTGVIFGVNTSTEIRNKFITLLRSGFYKNVELYEMIVDYNNRKLLRQNIKMDS